MAWPTGNVFDQDPWRITDYGDTVIPWQESASALDFAIKLNQEMPTTAGSSSLLYDLQFRKLTWAETFWN